MPGPVPKLFTRSSAGFLSIALVATGWLAFPDSAVAHRRRGGLGAFFDGAGSEAFSLVMSLLVLGMIAALLGVVFYFRWRAAHPLPEPESVRSVVEDGSDPGDSPSPPLSWEKSADWWKPKSRDAGEDETGG